MPARVLVCKDHGFTMRFHSVMFCEEFDSGIQPSCVHRFSCVALLQLSFDIVALARGQIIVSLHRLICLLWSSLQMMILPDQWDSIAVPVFASLTFTWIPMCPGALARVTVLFCLSFPTLP